METNFSQDVVPVTELKNNPAKVIQHASDSHRPVLLTSRGRGVAVMLSLEEYEKTREKMAFMQAVSDGLADVEAGRVFSVAEADKRLKGYRK